MLLSQLVLTLPVLLAHALHGGPEPPAEAPLLIHEWGTFTSLQDEEGRSLGWINTDDEPVPDFVHRIACPILGPGDEVNLRFVKSVPRGHPDVTMRLETPVVYFHPGPAHPDGTELDLTVEFRGGWLTEFFPQAEAEAPDFFRPRRTYPPLDGETVSRLTWPGLVLGGEPELPETDAGVWLAPRAVDSAPVTAASGEAEQYLFYRGVGHLEAPLRVSRSPGGDELWIRSNLDLAIEEFDELQIAHLWLVDVRADGHTAWRRLDPLCIGMDHETVQGFVPALFDERDHSLEAGEALRRPPGGPGRGRPVPGRGRGAPEHLGARLLPDEWAAALLPGAASLDRSLPAARDLDPLAGGADHGGTHRARVARAARAAGAPRRRAGVRQRVAHRAPPLARRER